MRMTLDDQEDAGEGYFASISDLMVGILFIFLLLLTVFAINFADEDKDKVIADLERKVARLESEIKGLNSQVANLTVERDKLAERNRTLEDLLRRLFVELAGIRVGIGDEQGRAERVRHDLLVRLQAALARREVQVEIESAQGVLRLSSEGLFANNEAEFTPRGRRSATALMEEMAQLLPCYASSSATSISCNERQAIFETVLIEGHTDTNPTGRPGGNWALSTDRARAFMELMDRQNSELVRLRNETNQPLLGLAGYGDSRARPAIPGADERNRRIEIRFLLAGRRESDLAEELRRLEKIWEEIRLVMERQQ